MTPARSAPGLSLIGLRGTGKSTVGRILAARLGRPFVDADTEIETRAGRPIREIFATDGEPAFRDWEERVVADLTTGPGVVLATGGGVVLRETNRRRLCAFGPVVWLTAPPDILAARLVADARSLADRPALTAAGTLDELAEVLKLREPLYRGLADIVVETAGLMTEQVAGEVLSRLLAR